MTPEELRHWLAMTDAKITFIGEPINPLSPRATLTTTVTYCSTRIFNVCGGTCTIYTGVAKCLDAPATQCLSAVTTETIDLGRKTLSIVREVGSVSYPNKQNASDEVLSELE